MADSNYTQPTPEELAEQFPITGNIPLNAFGSTNGWTPEERTQIAANTIDRDVFAERLFEQLESTPPLLRRRAEIT